MDDAKESYVTPELMSELDSYLEEQEEEEGLFDDFSEELGEEPNISTIEVSNTSRLETVREAYLKERRKYSEVALPDSVEE